MKIFNDNVFVMIPAYRDPDLLLTVETLYKNADNPERLRVVVASQYEDDKYPDLSIIPPEQLVEIRLHPDGRPGINRIRRLLQGFYNYEKWILSIDSHTIMGESWDTKLKDEFYKISESVGNNKIVLREATGYDDRGRLRDFVPRFVEQSWPAINENGETEKVITYGVDMQGEESFIASPGHFAKSLYLLTGTFFAPGQFFEENLFPYDNQAEQEEPYMSFQAYMKGWDIYIINVHSFSIIDHKPENYYAATKTEVIDEDGNKTLWLLDGYKIMQDEDLFLVMQQLLGAYILESGPYAIKDPVRTAQSFWKIAGNWSEYVKVSKKMFGIDPEKDVIQ